MTAHDLWVDPVWSKVIGGLIVIVITGVYKILRKLSWWPKDLLRSPLRKTEAYASDQSNDPNVIYKLKYYLEVINESKKCLQVRVAEYKPNAVTLQKFLPNTLQINLNGKWWPRPDSTDSVALLPHQRCRAWIGVDFNRFTKADLDKLEGKIGMLTLTANSQRIPFEL